MRGRGRGGTGGRGISANLQRARRLLGQTDGVDGNEDADGGAEMTEQDYEQDEIYQRFQNKGSAGFFATDSSGASRNDDSANLMMDEAARAKRQQQQQLMMAMMASSQQEQNYATAEVWCARHGRKIQFSSADSLDGGMSFVCRDPTECLMAPLDDPKILAAKGCAELWCAKHKRVRGARWLVVSADDKVKGFVCKSSHACRRIGEAATVKN